MFVNKSLTLPEIFDKARKMKSIDDKVDLIKAYDSKVLRWFVYSMYNQHYADLEIPEKWTPSEFPIGNTYMTMKHAIEKMNFCRANFKNNPKKVEKTLTIVLESVSKDEADLIIMLLEGKKAIKGISKTVFKKAYPDFFGSESSED